jgi:hypothetical protein
MKKLSRQGIRRMAGFLQSIILQLDNDELAARVSVVEQISTGYEIVA